MTPHATDSVSKVLRLAALLCLAGTLLAQDPPTQPEATPEADAPAASAPVTAWFVRRAYTVSGAPVDNAVIVVTGDKITAVGPEASVEIPAGATRMEKRSWMATPGFVHPAAQFFGTSERMELSGSVLKGDEVLRGRLDPSVTEVRQLAESGFTTVALFPSGGGVPGMISLVKPVPVAKTLPDVAALVRDDRAALALGFEPGTATREFMIKTLAQARKYISDLEAFQKGGAKPEAKPAETKPEEAKPAETKPAEAKAAEAKPAEAAKEGEKKPEEPKKEAAKEPTQDPKLMPLVEALRAKLPAVLALTSAAALLHAEPIFAAEVAFRPALLFTGMPMRGGPDLWRVLPQLKRLGFTVVLSPQLSQVPFVATRRCTQVMLLDAGIPLALLADQRAPGGLAEFRAQVLDLIRHGMDPNDALRSCTQTPADVLGLGASVGALAVGRNADVLLFDGEPFAPATRLVQVIVGGTQIYSASKEDN